MKKLNNTGFSVLHILLFIVVVGLIGGVGYYVLWQQQERKKASQEYTEIIKKNSEYRQDLMKQQTQDPAKYYTVDLPQGWRLTDEKLYIKSGDAFIYKDTTGKEIIVYVNATDGGGSSDGKVEYEVVNDKIMLDLEKVQFCTPGTTWCDLGSNMLEVSASSPIKIKSNSYFFDYRDTERESKESLSNLKMFVESMKF